MWLGTQTAGLNLFDPHTEKFYKFGNVPGDTSSLISNFVFSVFIDSQNRLLVGTSLGLNVVELNDLKSYVLSALPVKRISESQIKGIRINYITEDHYKNIWLGTDLGLYKLSADLKLIRSYSIRDGLPNNLVLGIKEDELNNLWITTKSGRSRLDPQTHNFKNFNVHDGLQGMEFQSKSIEKMPEGSMIIGGIDVFNIFNPEDIYLGSDYVQPIITGLRLFNKKVNAGDTINDRILLNKAIADTDELVLKYYEGYITFEFVALYYQNPDRVQYAYKLKGIVQDFIYSGSYKIENYSSLPPGNYTFDVKASVDRMWEDAQSSSVNVSILPPPWKTWWGLFFIYYIFSFCFVAGCALLYQRSA